MSQCKNRIGERCFEIVGGFAFIDDVAAREDNHEISQEQVRRVMKGARFVLTDEGFDAAANA